MDDFLKQYQQQQLREQENLVYRQMELELVGKTFESPRGYGHATYEILGGHGAWKETQNAEKRYGYLNDKGEWVFDYNSGNCFCLAVTKLGGYSGNPDPNKTLSVVLEAYRQKILELRKAR